MEMMDVMTAGPDAVWVTAAKWLFCGVYVASAVILAVLVVSRMCFRAPARVDRLFAPTFIVAVVSTIALFAFAVPAAFASDARTGDAAAVNRETARELIRDGWDIDVTEGPNIDSADDAPQVFSVPFVGLRDGEPVECVATNDETFEVTCLQEVPRAG